MIDISTALQQRYRYSLLAKKWYSIQCFTSLHHSVCHIVPFLGHISVHVNVNVRAKVTVNVNINVHTLIRLIHVVSLVFLSLIKPNLKFRLGLIFVLILIHTLNITLSSLTLTLTFSNVQLQLRLHLHLRLRHNVRLCISIGRIDLHTSMRLRVE